MTGDHFEYAEGFHTHGWFAPGKHIEGKHTRQIVFVKGPKPPETSYWVVFDTIEPKDSNEHTYEALFHIRRNHAGIADPKTKTVHGWDAGAALRIMPVPADTLDVELVHGQTEPHIQGWHVVGKAKAPMWTPIYRWQATGKTTRAWVLVPAGADQNWCVDRAKIETHSPKLLAVRCVHPDGSSTVIYRRDPSQPSQRIDGVELDGDVGAFSMTKTSEVQARFFVKPRADSVSAP